MTVLTETPAASDATRASPFLPFAPDRAPETRHIGLEDAPFVEIEPGFELQVLQVDLKQGLWIIRARWAPGATIARHYHAGPVFAVTLQGRWWYRESPLQVNSPGSYLYEPAGSIHTLTVPETQAGPTVVWFAIYGPNLNLDQDDQVTAIVDAASLLNLYGAGCRAMGRGDEHLIVGE